jgi:hypothetical protein
MNRRGFLNRLLMLAGAAPFVTRGFSQNVATSVIEAPPFDEQIILGYKGSAFLETGYVYCPHIPFYVTDVNEQWDELIKDPSVPWNDSRLQYLLDHL